MNQCYSCGAPATRSCTYCGKFCCEDHVTRSHAIKGAGTVCAACASSSWIWFLVVLVVASVIVLIVYWGFIKPDMERSRQKMENWRQTKKGSLAWLCPRDEPWHPH